MIRSAVALLAAVLVAATGVQAAGPPITPEALLAAGIPWPTVRQVGGADWWPQVPQFETQLFRQALPKRPVLVTSQWYTRVGSDVSIQTTLFTFAGHTEPGVCPTLAETDGVPSNAQVPAVGTIHVYWAPGDASAPVSIVCFERGPVMVEIKVLGQSWSADRMGKLARPVDASLKSLLAGKLATPAIAEALLARLPPSAAAPGKVLGTVALPAEAWASNASDPTPAQLLDRLKRGGSGTLLFRRYLLSDQTNVVDVTLFSFKNDTAAQGWFDTLADASALGSTPLAAAATGTHAVFRQVEQYYVLDFAVGSKVADITCYAPYEEQPSSACATALRRLGGRWYSQLSRG